MRGKTKIGTSAMILSMLLATIMAFGVVPVFAVGTIKLPTIVNPLATPGTTFITDVILAGYPSTTYIKHVEYKVHYDPAILNVYTVVPNRASPVYLSIIDSQVIDNVNGVLTFSVTRTPKPAPDPGGFIADYAILESVIGWTVTGIGTTALHFTDVVITDRYGTNVPTGTTDGFFDNRLQATISVPHVVDTSLTAGSVFDVYVYIGPWHDNPLQKMWGFQFILSFDPNVITPTYDYEAVAVSDEGYKFDLGPSEVGMDYVAISANSYFGDTVGLSSTVPVPVARIGFMVVADGVTSLTLSGTAIADVDGNSLLHEVDSGSFANTNNISVSLNTIFVARKWSVSNDGAMLPLTMQVTNTGAGITQARAVFKVYDSHGVLVDVAITPNADIYPGTTVRFATEIDVSKLGYPASYVVEGTVEYLDYMGSWAIGHKGWPTSPRMSMTKTFSLHP